MSFHISGHASTYTLDSMNPQISITRQHSQPTFGSQPASRNARTSKGVQMPRFFKRLFKFPQMDFEMAVWEMMSLIIAPKKVFRSIYYHVCMDAMYHWCADVC